ncbi:NnrU family protein [Sulfitobacter albidus]|uniref:NnrU family protein n=1 Tax=Sulfitobacter albidus TaxID=2829501 RepID=UPI0032AF7366
MTLLILGLILWIAAHYFKRLAPDARARLGDPGKGIIAVLIVASVVLMVLGYRAADFIPVWTPPPWFTGLNNLLMIAALWIYGSSAAKGAKAWPAYKTRHPQLLGFKLWAIAHLLVNGDLAAIVLFGGLLAWAVAQVILINRAEPDWTPPAPQAARPTSVLRSSRW